MPRPDRSSPKNLRVLPIIQSVIALGLFIGVIWFVQQHWAEVLTTVATAQRGDWGWLLLAVGAEVLFFYALAQSYAGVFRFVGIQLPGPVILAGLVGAQTLGVAMPSELLAEQTLFYRLTKQVGQSGPHIALGVILSQLANLAGFLLIFALGILALSSFRGLEWYELLVTSLLLALVLAVTVVGFLLIHDPALATRLLVVLQRWLRRLGRMLHWRRLDLSESRIERSQQAVTRAVQMIKRREAERTSIILWGIAGHILRIVALGCVLASLGLDVLPWQVVTTYAIGTLIWILSPLPQGIGLVESAYAVVLASLGLSPGVATSVSLIYRGVTFWLPFFIGILFLPRGSALETVTAESL